MKTPLLMRNFNFIRPHLFLSEAFDYDFSLFKTENSPFSSNDCRENVLKYSKKGVVNHWKSSKAIRTNIG